MIGGCLGTDGSPGVGWHNRACEIKSSVSAIPFYFQLLLVMCLIAAMVSGDGLVVKFGAMVRVMVAGLAGRCGDDALLLAGEQSDGPDDDKI